jgi:dihydroorotate dehydrogenase (NAD+) catalytic subunit
MADLHIQLAPSHPVGLLLKNPVITASGTFGYGLEYGDLLDINKLGAIVCKGTTLQPREGNPQPRLIEVTGGLLNSIGLQNIGIEALIRDKVPLWAKTEVPFIVNIAGDTVEEYRQIALKLNGLPGISGIEINISCPNVSCGGMEFGTNPQSAAEVTSAVRSASSVPVLVKLSPNVTDIKRIAQAVADAGADAITVINTLRGMAINLKARKPALGNTIGGLSGPAIKPIALYMVYKVAKAVRVPVIGCGGITSTEDALEFLMAGASAVQIGTANLPNPRAAMEIIDGLNNFFEQKNIKGVHEIIGIAAN